MSDNQKECKSRIHWWEKIERLAEGFAQAINNKLGRKKGFIELDLKRLRSALELYEFNWGQFKNDVFGKAAEESRIDRHKIASLYILAFLTKNPFEIMGIHPDDKKVKQEHLLDLNNMYLFFANELFSLVFMRDVVFSWGEKDIPFGMGENEKAWFMILLNSLKLELELESSKVTQFKESLVLSLSQTIYYIEEIYSNQD